MWNWRLEPSAFRALDVTRSRSYPLPPIEQTYATLHFAEASRSLGYQPFPMPTAILSRDYDGRKRTGHCGFCQSFECTVDAKASTRITATQNSIEESKYHFTDGPLCNPDHDGGLYDMLGNAWEWCWDLYVRKYMDPTEYFAAVVGQKRPEVVEQRAVAAVIRHFASTTLVSAWHGH